MAREHGARHTARPLPVGTGAHATPAVRRSRPGLTLGAGVVASTHRSGTTATSRLQRFRSLPRGGRPRHAMGAIARSRPEHRGAASRLPGTRHRMFVRFLIRASVAAATVAMLISVFGLSRYHGIALDAAPPPLPIAIPLDATACDGTDTRMPWIIDAPVVIPIGKACPLAAGWLGWGQPHGADESHQAGNPVDWILHPGDTELDLPSWQDVLTGRSRARLAD